MSKSASPRFVSVTCACGAEFQREVKRGRPQVWCETCSTIPFYERTARAEAPVAADPAAAAPAVDPATRPNDPLAAVRDTVEAEVAAVYAAQPAVLAEAIAFGLEYRAACTVAMNATAEALREVYGKYR